VPRLLVILANKGWTVEDRPMLMEAVRRLGLDVINVRVGTRHVEVDVRAGECDVGRLGELAPILEIVDVEREEEGLELEEAVRRFVELARRERFWECHRVLEDVWRRTGSEAVRGLILLAAAHAKTQEGGDPSKLLAEAEKALAGVDRLGCLDVRRALELARSLRLSEVSCVDETPAQS